MKNEGTGVDLLTEEGAAAVKECIDFLNNATALAPFEWKEDMAKACRDHANDTGPKGATGHDGTNGSTLSDRLKKYGEPVASYGENLSFGQTTGR